MASTNSTTKSSLNISTESDNKNLYTDQSTYVVTGNEEAKKFHSIQNDTYTIGQDENNKKEINAKLLAYNDGIIRKGSELDHGEEDVEEKTRYTIYGQPDKWIMDYEQLYQNCGVDSCLNILSMAGVKDIQQVTDEYNEWLNTPTVIDLGNDKTKEVYNKPMFTYETEQEFTLWAIQNSKNDQYLYRDLYQYLNEDPSEYDQEYWELRDKTKDSYVIHSKNYTEYTKVEDIDEYKDGGSYDWMQVNILNHFGVNSKIYSSKDIEDRIGQVVEPASLDTKIMKLNDIKTYVSPITSKSTEIIRNDEEPDASGHYTKIERITETSDTGDSYEETITVTTKIYVKKDLIKSEGQDEQGNPKIEYENTEITLYSESEITKTTQNYNEYKTVVERSYETKSNPKPSADKITKVEEVDKIEYDTAQSSRTTTDYTLNKDKYTFSETLAQAVKDGKGIILSGNAYGLIDNEDEDYAGHSITLVGVVEGKRLYRTASGNNYYKNDIVGFYVIDTGGWLSKTEKAQFVSCQTLYNFITNFAKSTTRDIEYEDWSFVGTINCIRDWADELNLIGTKDKNVLTGNNANNKLYGKDGDDFLYGEGGNDSIYGENNDDVLFGGSGDDYIDCGKGNDVVVIEATDVVAVDEYGHAQYDEQNKPITTTQKDTVIANLGVNTLQFVNIDLNSLEISSNNSDLVIKYNRTTGVKYEDEFKYHPENIPIGMAQFDHTWHMNAIELAEPSSVVVKNYFKNGVNTIKNLVEVNEQVYVYYQKDEDGEYILDDDNMPLVDYEKTYRTPTQEAHDFVKEYLNGRELVSVAPTDTATTITGSAYKDILTGGDYSDVIKGYENNDILYGAGGSDIIYAGSGNDTIYGSYGNDKYYGEVGTTTIKYENNFEINGQNYTGFGGNDYIYNGKGQDFIELTSINANQLKFAKSGNDLTVCYRPNTTGDSITIQNYFKLKGNTSVKSIKLANNYTLDLVNQYNTISANLTPTIDNSKNKGDATGSIGDDKLYASNNGSIIDGKLGNDSIFGGKGNDTITGGYGDDIMTGNGGVDTYCFDFVANGYDTIKPASTGTTILKFTNNELNFDNPYGVAGGQSGITETTKLYDKVTNVNFSYAKSKNDLIINYATAPDNTSTATIKVLGFYNSKADFILKDNHGHEINLKSDVYTYMEANKDKATKLTGSNYNDYMVGFDKNDTLNAGKGNDTLIGGEGNDTITGGIGENTYVHNKGDGDDTIVFTKGEKAYIRLQGFNSVDDISYKTSGNNLLLCYTNKNGATSTITLKNFYKTDVTGTDGAVTVGIYKENINEETGEVINQELLQDIDLKNDNILPKYTDFNSKKSTYNGTYLSDVIDASSFEGLKNNKGVTIDGKTGNDSIIGSIYNDTLKGGLGEDIIDAGAGKNTVDGGEGSDTYKIFVSPGAPEDTTIKDTGKAGNDEIIVYGTTDNVSIWFNMDKYGNWAPVFNINSTEYDSRATVSGVEKITLNNNTADNVADDKSYGYNDAELRQNIVTFLNNRGYSDAAYVINETYGNDHDELLALYQTGWQQQ